MGERITQAEYARRRSLSPSYVSQLVRKGKILKGDDRLIDVEQADAARNYGKQGRPPKKSSKGATPSNLDDGPPPAVPDPGKHSLSQADASAWDAQWRAYNRMLEALEREKKLIRRDEVEAVAQTILVTVATQLDGVAGRMAQHLAGETDPAVVKQDLNEEMRRIRENVAAELERAATPDDGSKSDSATAAEGG